MNAFKERLNPPPAYFYCSRNPAEPGHSDPGAILASIARQLSCLGPGCPLLLLTIAAYDKQEDDAFADGPLQLHETRDLILQLAEHYLRVTIVIDALDECDQETRKDLLDAVEFILREASTVIKIFISSRDDQDIVFKF